VESSRSSSLKPGFSFETYAPEKLELIRGDVVAAEKLLLLVLTNLGLHRAALLVGPEEWRRALDEEGTDV